MALVLKDRVKETTTTTGTGTVTLAGAAAGFQTFGVVGNGNTTYYAIVDNTTGDWEVGIGTYTASGTTLSRTTVLSSSNSGSLVTFAAGSKDVFCTYPSSKSVYLDAADVVAQLSFGAITATSVAMTTGTITTQPVNNTDIVNKEYADALASGIHFHEAVDLATTAALPANTYNNGTGGVGATLTANANGALSVDSTLTVVGNRILVKNQAAGLQNGVYDVTQVGSAGAPYILTRSSDMDSVGTGVDQIDEGDFFLVTSGTANVNTAWVQQTPPPITIGTTAIVFQQFSAPITYTAGTGLSESPTYTFNIANTGTAGTYGSASAVPVFVTNAQGQVTSVTNTAIAINGSAVSGNITGQAGSVANALTAGSFLTSGGTYNGSAARTFAVDATDANTASKVVARDASGNFAAGTITAALSGNATSATNVAGGAANRIVFNTGSGATSFVVAPTASGQVLNWNGSAFNYVAGTISGVALGSNLNSLTAGTYLTGTAYNGSGAQTWTVDATSANTVSKVVARDSSGNFAAGTITAALSGNATTATTAGTITGQANSATITATSANTINQIVLRDGSGNFSAGTITAALNGNASTATSATTSGSTSGNAATATALQTARNIGGVSFNGTANIDLPGVNISGNQNTSGNAATATTATSLTNGTSSITKNSSYGWNVRSDQASTSIILLDSGGATRGWYYADGSNQQGFLSNVGSWVWRVTNAGDCTATGSVTATSFSGAGTGLTGTASSLSIGGNAATATTASNLSGLTLNNVSVPINPDNVVQNQLGYASSVSLFGQTDGGLYSSAYSSAWIHQIFGDFRTGQIAIRGKNSGTWQAWRVVLDSSNYTSYAPSLTGSGASGTWGIAITGNSGNTSSISNAVGGTYTWTGPNRFQSSTNTSGSADVPLQAFSTSGNGAIMAFHRGGVYAVNMGLDSDNVFRFGGWSAPANLLQITMAGALTMASNVTAHSDERLKKDWTSLPDDFIAKLAKLKSGTYTRIDSGERHAGVGAQSLQPLLPEAVLADSDGTLSVAYGNAALVSAVELAKDNVELRARIEKLEAMVAKLIER
jgi:hypothetical protein